MTCNENWAAPKKADRMNRSALPFYEGEAPASEGGRYMQSYFLPAAAGTLAYFF